MSLPWRQLPPPARAIAAAVTDAVSAAQSHDLEALQEAAAQLAACDSEHVGIVLGAVVRSLLEVSYPDGLTGDDAHDVLKGCLTSAIGWFPDVDASVLIVLLTGALGIHETGIQQTPGSHDSDGIHEQEEQPRPPSGRDIAMHAPLLVADLVSAGRRPLAGYLMAAFAEIERAETIEMP